MSDRFFMPLIALIAFAMIALAMVWPQGYGARSPAPFGSTPIQQTAQMKAKIQREKDAAQKRADDAIRAVKAAGGQAQ